MIKIIKEGKIKKHECQDCGCLFSYEPEDTSQLIDSKGVASYISCPQCETVILLEKRSLYED